MGKSGKEVNLVDGFKASGNAINKVEELGKDFKKEVGKFVDKFGKNIDLLSKDLGQGGDKLFPALKNEFKKEIDKLPPPIQKPVKDFLFPIIDNVGKVAQDFIGGKNNVKELAQTVFKEATNVVKSIFSNISALIKGEKKADKALNDVTKTCEKAGGAIMKAAEKVKKSFVEMVGGIKEKAVSHVEKVTKESGKGQGQGRG